MPKTDRSRSIPPEVIALLGEPGREPRQSEKSVSGPTGEAQTVVFHKHSRHAVSPERAALREALPTLYKSMSVNEIAAKFNVPSNLVRNDILYLQKRNLLPRKSRDQNTENLPYEQAFERMKKFEEIIFHAVQTNNNITIPELMELLKSQLEWATEINETATRAIWNRARKEISPDS